MNYATDLKSKNIQRSRIHTQKRHVEKRMSRDYFLKKKMEKIKKHTQHVLLKVLLEAEKRASSDKI